MCLQAYTAVCAGVTLSMHAYGPARITRVQGHTHVTGHMTMAHVLHHASRDAR